MEMAQDVARKLIELGIESVLSSNVTSHVLQETEILVSGNPRCLQVHPDDGDGHFIVGWDDNRSEDTWFRIGTMAPFLPGELKTSGQEQLLQNLPMYRCYSWHFQRPTTAECLSIATQAGPTQFSSWNS